VKISFRNKGEIKTFSNEEKCRAFVTHRSTLEEWLNGSSLKRGNGNRRELVT